MKDIRIGQKEIIHFIGIGGIGMSGLAQVMKTMGFKIQGSDLNINKNVENCKNLGIKFFKGHKKSNIKNATILVLVDCINIYVIIISMFVYKTLNPRSCLSF